MADWVMTRFCVISLNDLFFPSPAIATAQIAALWYVSNAAMTLATMSATISVLFSADTHFCKFPMRWNSCFFLGINVIYSLQSDIVY